MSSNQYPENIMRILRERNDLDPDDHSFDAVFQHMSKEDVFSAVLEWEGIIGYSYTLLGWIRDIFKVDLCEM